MGMDIMLVSAKGTKGQWYVCKCDDTKIGMKKMQMNQSNVSDTGMFSGSAGRIPPLHLVIEHAKGKCMSAV